MTSFVDFDVCFSTNGLIPVNKLVGPFSDYFLLCSKAKHQLLSESKDNAKDETHLPQFVQVIFNFI